MLVAHMQLRRTSLLLVIAAVGAWLALGLGLVPYVLERAYRGESIAFLNRALAPYATIPYDFILSQWMDIVMIGAIATVVLIAFAYVMALPETARRIVGEATPGDIGAIRMLVCAVLLTSALWEDLASTAALPRDQIRPMGVVGLLYALPIGFDRFAASGAALRAFDGLTSAVLFFGMIGWKTRWMVPMGAVCYLIFGGLLRQYAWFYHTGLLGFYLLAVLALLPSQDGFSIDRWRRVRRGQPVIPEAPSRRYGWMRFALWTTFALPYVMAGLSKLRNGGILWWEASNFKFILFQSALRPMEFDFDLSLALASAPEALFEVLALSAVAGEILYGLVLFSRRARWIMPTVMLLMHVGILLLQNILFFDLIVLQAIFFNFRPLLQTMPEWIKLRIGMGSEPDFSPSANQRAVSVRTRSSDGLRSPGNARMTLVIAGMLTTFWLFRVEFYPITGMQMFSTKRTEPVTYEVLLAHCRSGELERAPVEKSIKAMSDGRYRRVLQMAFDPGRERITAAFLDSVRGRWNRSTANPLEHIDGFEIQQWEWHFLSEPASPEFGRMVRRKVYPFGGIEAATEAISVPGQ